MKDNREIKKAKVALKATVTVPGSKSITQRALVTAALGEGQSLLEGCLDSEDTRLLRQALSSLGVDIREEGRDTWRVTGCGGRIAPSPSDEGIEIFMGNNGTGIRFLASLLCLGEGEYLLTGSERMAQRPIGPLLDALNQWGGDTRALSKGGCPPVEIKAHGLEGGTARLAAGKSSQFLSSMLLVAPYTRRPARIELEGPLVSRPYVDITLKVIEAFGLKAREAEGVFQVPQGRYRGRSYQVEGDASSASYFWAAAAVTGGRVTVANIPPDPMQGDAAIADIFGRMGCEVEKGPGGVTVTGPASGGLEAVEVDMGRWPDMVPTLAVVAAFAKGTTRITNCAHLRIKETDRLAAVAAELSRIGVEVNEGRDFLEIKGGRPLKGAVIKTYDDHRIAMAFAIAGLCVEGITIEEPQCVVKSFPGFWKAWATDIEET